MAETKTIHVLIFLVCFSEIKKMSWIASKRVQRRKIDENSKKISSRDTMGCNLCANGNVEIFCPFFSTIFHFIQLLYMQLWNIVRDAVFMCATTFSFAINAYKNEDISFLVHWHLLKFEVVYGRQTTAIRWCIVRECIYVLFWCDSSGNLNCQFHRSVWCCKNELILMKFFMFLPFSQARVFSHSSFSWLWCAM